MKKLFLFVLPMALCLTACQTTRYGGNRDIYGQVNQTQVVLNQANFNVLGSFSGTATGRASTIYIKGREGLVTQAKQNFLDKARAAGVEMTGPRAIVNTSVDYMTNGDKITVTFTDEIIEFTK